ncbi:UNVERIFIED_CONTAM: GTP cyclohydrolase 1 type 2-like protein [Trichonephila clavipes]
MLLNELVSRLDDLLQAGRFNDYCPNGLQVQGRAEVRHLVSGVTASEALIDAAIAEGADAILVHHGYFWKGENPVVTGMKRRRLGKLLAHDISLIAYHLPLDAHPVLGNNAQLAGVLGLMREGPLFPDPRQVGDVGVLPEAVPATAFAAHIGERLGRMPLHVPGADRPIRRVAWCTGGAQGFIDQAIAQGVDAYLSGEISEQTTHAARESGVHYYALGHHVSERYGARALGAWCARELGLSHCFIDIDNPA